MTQTRHRPPPQRPLTDEERRAIFINEATPGEMNAMLHVLIGYTPDGFDFAAQMVERKRAERAGGGR